MKRQEKFFYTHASLCVNQGETAEKARTHVAKAMARAETLATEAGVVFHWIQDTSSLASDFDEMIKRGDPSDYYLWDCVAYLGNQCIASLGGIDMGRVFGMRCDWMHPLISENHAPPYKRVVEAELAMEGLREIEEYLEVCE